MKLEINFKDLKKLKDRVMVRKYKDMSESFKTKIKLNPVLYKVYIKDFGNFETGLTVIYPGKIGNQFYMTKGHRHVKPINEIYILINGSGKLLVKDKKLKTIYLKKNKIYNIPGNSGHRLVNTGKTELEVLTIYSKDAGHDYKFKF